MENITQPEVKKTADQAAETANIATETNANKPENTTQSTAFDAIADFFKLMTFGIFKFAFWKLPTTIIRLLRDLGWKKIWQFLCSIWRAVFWFTVWVTVVFAAWIAFGLQQFLRFWRWVGLSICNLFLALGDFVKDNAGIIWFIIAIIGSVYGLLYLTLKKRAKKRAVPFNGVFAWLKGNKKDNQDTSKTPEEK